jgi:16S rRNA (cytidine1402-2'-O)-methyltransferase
MANLYIVATPIGNLNDITLRAVNTLKSVDLILSEDTRVTRKLLEHYQIKTKTISYHQHSKLHKINYIIDLLKQGSNIALVSDAGVPGVADPGNKLVELVVKELGSQVNIVPIPGCSAIMAAASVSGFKMDKFLFLGFPPAKKKRSKFFQEIADSKYPVVFYESPYKIIKTLESLVFLKQEIVVCRELTKKFETIYRGSVEEAIEVLKKDAIKGEFTVITKGS